MSETLPPEVADVGTPPPPATRSLEVVLREALAAGEEVRLIVAKALADDVQNANAYLNVEIEGTKVVVPKLAGAGLGGPTAGYPVYLLAALDFLLALGTVKGSAAGALPTEVPIGAVLPYGGLSAPGGYVLADGGFYSKTTYAALYGVYGVRYGDGGTTFGVPNLCRRVPVGRGSGGSGGYELGVTEGLAEGSRGPYHHHHLSAGVSVSVGSVGDHQHPGVGGHQHSTLGGGWFAETLLNTGQRGTAATLFNLVTGNAYPSTAAAGDHQHGGAGGHGHSASGSVDSDTSGSNGQDSPAFAVLNFIIRAT
jgi:microcystin-dependent protein